ncbi:CvpA family protein [Melaminivora jejuensis]|uniref:CvpA family protein n=1 Tax=Melaminivora jejuensis TaxID=1267217 RepID=UPI001AE0A71C|nr:CvpA family protein [Melaminivora jejuensis]UHJ63680.1 CvpA family protein [Melaminivora jejuensis]
MTALDWLFLAVLAASLLIGAWRGLVFELLSLLGWAVAFVAAQWLAADAGAWLPLQGWDAAWRHAAGFALVFVAAVFAFGLLTALVRKLVDAVGLRPADRALGALFGIVRGLLALLALALVVGWLQMADALWWRQSQGAPLLQLALQSLQPALPEALGRNLPTWSGP